MNEQSPFVRPVTTLVETGNQLRYCAELEEAHKHEIAKSCETFERKIDEARTGKFVRILKPTPPKISHQFSQMSAEFKHALDQSVNASLFYQTGKISNAVHFPSGKTRNDFEHQLKIRCIDHGISPRVVNCIRSMEPYEEGNAALYQLCKFARNKHRDFLKLAPSPVGVYPRGGILIAGDEAHSSRIGVSSTENPNEYEVARYAFGGYNSPTFGIAIEVQVAEPGTFQGKHWISALDYMVDLAMQAHKGIVDATKLE